MVALQEMQQWLMNELQRERVEREETQEIVNEEHNLTEELKKQKTVQLVQEESKTNPIEELEDEEQSECKVEEKEIA